MAFCINPSDHESLIDTVTTTVSSTQSIERDAIVQLPTSFAEPFLDFIAESNIKDHNISLRARRSCNSIAHSRTGEQKSKGSTGLKAHPVIVGAIGNRTQTEHIPVTVCLLATFSNHNGPDPDISKFPRLLQSLLVHIYPLMPPDDSPTPPHQPRITSTHRLPTAPTPQFRQ